MNLLTALEHAGVYRLLSAEKPRLLAAAQALGWQAATVYPKDCPNTDAWLGELGKALEFPAYFAANFDALFDCLTDSAIDAPIHANQGFLLFLGNLDAMGDDAKLLISVFQATNETWKEQGRRLWVFLDCPCALEIPDFKIMD